VGQSHSGGAEVSRRSSRFLTRNVQQYIDGMLLYSENLHEDRGADAFDKPTYDAAVVAAGGPLSTCYKLGVGW
jgi:hypothetical protein